MFRAAHFGGERSRWVVQSPAERDCTMTLDKKDQDILAARVAAFDPTEGPRVGDHVEFADGVIRLISYVWTDGAEWLGGVQTSDGGSFYLGHGRMQFSGSLYMSVPHETLTLTEDTRETRAWFFHHDYHTAHNGIDVPVTMRLWKSTATAPKC
jgi:hypothetical protein